MKLFLYDVRHNQVIRHIDLDTGYDVGTIRKVLDILKVTGILNEYSTLVVAESWHYEQLDEEDGGENYVVFDNVVEL